MKMTFRRWIIEKLAGDRYLVTDIENPDELEFHVRVNENNEDFDNVERSFKVLMHKYDLRADAINNFNEKVESINTFIEMARENGLDVFGITKTLMPAGKFGYMSRYHLNFQVRGPVEEISRLKKRLKGISDRIMVSK